MPSPSSAVNTDLNNTLDLIPIMDGGTTWKYIYAGVLLKERPR